MRRKEVDHAREASCVLVCCSVGSEPEVATHCDLAAYAAHCDLAAYTTHCDLAAC